MESDDAAWMGLCDDPLQDALRASVELLTDLELNPAAREFGDRRLAGMSLEEIRYDLTSYQRRDENRRLAACAARDELEARLLRDVTTAAQQEAAQRAVARPEPAAPVEPVARPPPQPVARPPPARPQPKPLPVPVDRAVARLCRSHACSALQTMASRN